MQGPAPGKEDPQHPCSLGTKWLGNSFAEKDLGVLVDESGQGAREPAVCSGTKEGQKHQGCIHRSRARRVRKVITPSTQHWLDHV